MITNDKLHSKIDEINHRLQKFVECFTDIHSSCLLARTKEYVEDVLLLDMLKYTTKDNYDKLNTNGNLKCTYQEFVEGQIGMRIAHIGWDIDFPLKVHTALSYLTILVDDPSIDKRDVLAFLYNTRV